MPNKKLSVQYLVSNLSFRRYALGQASSEEIINWDRWIEKDDCNRKKAKKAISIIAGLEFKSNKSPDANKALTKLKRDIPLSNTSSYRQMKSSRSSLIWFMRVAAGIALGALITIGSIFLTRWLHNNPHYYAHTVTTPIHNQRVLSFGQGRKIILAEGSTLKYNRNANQMDVRLKGKAYFKNGLHKQHRQSVFRICTTNGCMKDMGTEFTVDNKNGTTNVVVNEGTVSIQPQDARKKKAVAHKGELLSFNKKKILSHRQVNASFYTSWATNFIEFNHTSLQKISYLIHQKYDIETRFMNSRDRQIEINGGIYFESFNELIGSISKVSNTPFCISKNDHILHVGKNSLPNCKMIKLSQNQK